MSEHPEHRWHEGGNHFVCLNCGIRATDRVRFPVCTNAAISEVEFLRRYAERIREDAAQAPGGPSGIPAYVMGLAARYVANIAASYDDKIADLLLKGGKQNEQA